VWGLVGGIRFGYQIISGPLNTGLQTSSETTGSSLAPLPRPNRAPLRPHLYIILLQQRHQVRHRPHRLGQLLPRHATPRQGEATSQRGVGGEGRHLYSLACTLVLCPSYAKTPKRSA
jgi:hypothetical protein